MNERLLFALVNLVGRVVVVRVKDGTEYTGNLYTVEPGQNGGLMIVLKFARLKESGPAGAASSELKPSTILQIPAELFVELKAVDVEFSTTGDVREMKTKPTAAGFSTDGEISHGKAVRVGRELQALDQSWLEESSDNMTFDDVATNEPFDQFAANNIVSDYDDSFYTTKLDAKSLPSHVLALAARLESEISGSHSDNPHVREERGLVDDSGMDEEDKYSGVGKSGIYIPPNKRAAAAAKAAASAGDKAVGDKEKAAPTAGGSPLKPSAAQPRAAARAWGPKKPAAILEAPAADPATAAQAHGTPAVVVAVPPPQPVLPPTQPVPAVVSAPPPAVVVAPAPVPAPEPASAVSVPAPVTADAAATAAAAAAAAEKEAASRKPALSAHAKPFFPKIAPPPAAAPMFFPMPPTSPGYPVGYPVPGYMQFQPQFAPPPYMPYGFAGYPPQHPPQ